MTEVETEASGLRAKGGKEHLLLVALLLFAGILRFSDLATPNFEIFDEYYYVQDACTYVSEGQFFCGVEEMTIEHPPMGKWLIAIGIWAFTPTPFGSRMMAALLGTLSVGLLFLIARRILGSPLGAAVAGLLLAMDFLHLVVSRTALLDIFLSFFLLLALLLSLRDIQARSSREQTAAAPRPSPDGSGLSRDLDWSRLWWFWRPLAGVALGFAIATKWTAAPMVAVLAALTLVLTWRGQTEASVKRSLLTVAKNEAASVLVCFLLIPVLVYCFTYAGRVEGALLTWPWAEGSWVRAVAERQVEMFRYHIELRQYFSGERAPFQSSPAWSWPLIQRPIPFAFAARGGDYREVLALGNPLVWWPALVCLIVVLGRAARTGKDRLATLVIWAGFGGTYLYWLLFSPETSNLFLYYFVPAVPFLCLAVGAAAAQMASRSWGRATVAGYLLLVGLSLAFFYPVLTWRPLDPDQWRRRVPFSQCDHYEIGDLEVVAGYPYPVDLFGAPIPAYPDGKPNEEFVPLLTTRAGWCWR